MTRLTHSPLRTALAVAALSTAFGALAADHMAGADKSFVEKAAIGGMAEVQLGKLAQEKGANDQVKQFGAKMVQDHSKANDELKQVASSKSIQLPTDLDAKHKNDVKRMQGLSGPAFDKAYMSYMVADHKKDVADFQKEAKSGKDADVKAFAAKTVPTLQEHLHMAQQAEAAVRGGQKSASR